MNARERVIAAINHRQTDRVPFDCRFGHIAYEKLRTYIGSYSSGELRPSGPDLTVSPSPAFLQELNVDLIYVGPSPGEHSMPFDPEADLYVDEWGLTWKRIESVNATYFEVVNPPLKDADLYELENYPWPDPYEPSRTQHLEEKCRKLYTETELAIVGRFSSSVFEQAFLLRGFEQFLIDLVVNPDFANALLQQTTRIAVGFLEVCMHAAGKYIQILRLAGDDMGHQSGTLLSPQTFRQMIKPHFKRVYQTARRLINEINPEIKLMAHTDGDVYSLIPDYIDMGLDILNPVQPRVSNMDHSRLKREFGEHLSFHGGIDIQYLMPFGSPDEVRQEAAHTIKVLGEGGGYILGPTHYLQADVPPENILALKEVVLGSEY